MKTQSERFIIGKDREWEKCGDGITRQIMGYDADLMLVKALFEQGSTGAMHHHPHAQSSYVASGRFEVTINGTTRVLAPGDGYYVDPDLLHGVYCLETGILIETFSPCRKDFLQE